MSNRRARTAPVLAIILGLMMASTPVDGQEPPSHYAITGARVVTGAGDDVPSGTVLVRDGLIVAVGPDVDVPPEAWTLEASGLTVYPGLVDGLTTLGLPGELREDGGSDERAEHSWGPEDRPATFSWVRAADHLETDDDRIAAWRGTGFTTAVTVPERGLFPGQAAVIGLAGERPGSMVVDPAVALRAKLDEGRGFPGYPASLMGAIAYVRQSFLDADHYRRARSVYDSSPSGLERPAYDRALEALLPAVTGRQPVLLPADRAREIRRVLRIAREVGVRPILYGAHEAWKVADELAAARVPVLVSLDWPSRDPDADPKLEERIEFLRFLDRAPTTPAALHAAGVPFAFTSGKLSPPDDVHDAVRLAIRAGLPADAALHALTLGAAEIFGVDDRLGSIEPGKIANLVLADGDLFAPGTRVRTTIVDGRRFETAARGAVAAEGDEDEAGADAYEPVPMAEDRGPVRRDDVVLVRNATVMTAADAATLENASILVRDGKIAAVGADVEAPQGAHVIDADDHWVIPGIIDAHSHIAAESINEGAVAVSSMVGIQDVLDPDDIGIYRGLAGGVTTANVLHGSANPIGGKNAVIKLRWGRGHDGLLVDDAPPGIKFALGENTKRDRDPDRYPSSRMGVQDVIRTAFLEAREYRERHQLYEQALADGQEGLIPPRRDLKLDPLVEILEGRRLVHAHSYRADEILQLLRTAEEFGFRIASLQHVLEGYRVADEIAAHGAGASTFSDWWAYKVEAYEAIPHNAALMAERGVVVSINSDSGEEMRHLNQEAAKTIKWGGASREEALRMVTLNPAIQLGIDHRVGSIEVGKDADLVIYDQDPLSVYAVPHTVLIDGWVWFDRDADMERRDALRREKERLLERHPAPASREDRPIDTPDDTVSRARADRQAADVLEPVTARTQEVIR